MVNEKQPLELRCAVLYCFQCFLFKNEFGQAQIVQTLLPNAMESKKFAFKIISSLFKVIFFVILF
jgi:general vesicular transport factor p115